MVAGMSIAEASSIAVAQAAAMPGKVFHVVSTDVGAYVLRDEWRTGEIIVGVRVSSFWYEGPVDAPRVSSARQRARRVS